MVKREPTQTPEHPGAYVRRHVFPKGMTVTKAAALLGIGRPALSNFLNGRASLSQEMALRLERVFRVDREVLLNLQTHFDRRDQAIRTLFVAGRHAPTVVEIKAHRIEQWAETRPAREDLPALLRRLVYATGEKLVLNDFPAFDNAERPGWDGIVEAETPTPSIPEGKSGWELGCSATPGRKAQQDYATRVKSVPPEVRRGMTFVFVTPRNWPGKREWAKEKADHGEWKDVRAYDASDLEQWLEQSAETQIWFAERLGIWGDGYRSLDRCWSDWSGVCDPVLSPELFDSSVRTASTDFQRWLGEPPTRPFIVAADSRDEALAFLYCLVREVTTSADDPGTGALVFDSSEALRRYRASDTVPRIAVVHDDRVEREIGELLKRCHCVITRPGHDVDGKPDIRLGLPDWKGFSEALKSMQLSDDKIETFARESGRSPTVLRRRLSTSPAVRTPTWAGDARTARTLVPAALVGAWRTSSPSDRKVVQKLYGSKDDNDVERGVMELLALEDAPLWSTGEYRGVVSRIDALIGIAPHVTDVDLERFFSAAERVLSEADPALDLPEEERWAAAVHGKVRNHSAALREGMRETLVLLSVHGDTLFRNRLDHDLEVRVSSLIHRLLAPLTIDGLLSHQDDLPDYAEAAPDTFLKLIEADLQEQEPAVFGLLKPADSGPFGQCLRTSLLWALECLAWNNLGRVSLILARLSMIAIDDNYVNKPINSLGSLYRSWSPRTASSLTERMRSLETLTRRFPDIGWQICVAQLNTGPQIAFSNHRPRWRDDASSAAQGVSPEQFHEFWLKALDLVLAWPKHDQRTLGDLVELIHDLPDDCQIKVWNLIDAWADADADDKARAGLRERIRRTAFSRRSRLRGMRGEVLERARTAYERLEPSDPVVRHKWLFSNSWIEPSADGFEGHDIDYEKHAETIRGLRVAGMKEIWTEHGLEGVFSLLSDCGTCTVVGEALEPAIPDKETRVEFLKQCLSETAPLRMRVEWCLRGFLCSVGEEARGSLLSATAENADTDVTARLYRCAPFGRHTWRLLDRYDSKVQGLYWREVIPEWNRHDEMVMIELIDRLLDAKRPNAAFYAAHLDWPKVETSRLKRLLHDIATADYDPEDHYLPEAHQISDALDELEGHAGVNRDEMAQLEFMYIHALDHSRHGIPNLERWICESPLGFVQILALLFKRDDGGRDPSEWRIENAEKRREMATAAHRLLGRINRVPGTGDGGEMNVEELSQWMAEVRRLCAEHGRAGIGDHYVGQILARAQADDDGIRPCRAVCEAMESVGSQEVASGFIVGIRNGRGVTTREVGEGGAQERELAAKYRDWARQRSLDFPYVGSILEDIAAHYDREALRHDNDAEVGQRLGH